MDNEQDLAQKQPTFAGRLQIQDFMFSPSPTPSAGLRTGTGPATNNNQDGASPGRRSARLKTASGSGRDSLSPAKSLQNSTRAMSSPLSPSRTRSSSAINRKQTPSPLLHHHRHKASASPSPPPSPSQSPSLPISPSPASSSPSKKRPRKRVPSTYAPPSTYAHLDYLPDALAPNLLILFIGLNPGISTAITGHAYAHPSNLFWKLLYSSGITPIPCTADEDRSMPERFSLGLTNIVSRPSRNGAELSKKEMDAGVAVLEAKCYEWRPEVVCVVGKSIWESIYRVRKGRAPRKDEFQYGWQEGERMGAAAPSSLPVRGVDPLVPKVEQLDSSAEQRDQQQQQQKESGHDHDQRPWQGSKIFVASSTSGLAATLKPAEKQAIWKELGDWCVERRRQRQKEAGAEEEHI